MALGSTLVMEQGGSIRRVKLVEGQPRTFDRVPVRPTPRLAPILSKPAKALNSLAPCPGKRQSAEMEDRPDHSRSRKSSQPRTCNDPTANFLKPRRAEHEPSARPTRPAPVPEETIVPQALGRAGRVGHL
jgi:hypothetical protein